MKGSHGTVLLPVDATRTSQSEAEPRVVRRVAEHDHDAVTGLPALAQPVFDQVATDPASLVAGSNGTGPRPTAWCVAVGDRIVTG